MRIKGKLICEICGKKINPMRPFKSNADYKRKTGAKHVYHLECAFNAKKGIFSQGHAPGPVYAKLTSAQAKVVEWALGGMESLTEEDMIELWGEVRDGYEVYRSLRKNVLDLTNWNKGMVDDLVWRLEEQYQDMAGYEFEAEGNIGALSQARAAMNAAKKIRDIYSHAPDPGGSSNSILKNDTIQEGAFRKIKEAER